MRIQAFLLFLMIFCVITVHIQSFPVADAYNDAKSSKTGIYFNKDFYKIGQKAVVTLVDKNLNRHYDAIDFYRPVNGFIILEIDDRKVSDSFISKIFRGSFKETGAHTGIFKALLKIPSADETGKSIKGREIRINYFDIHNNVTWHDTITVL